MTFLNAALLGGIAAVSIPIIIHLWNRSRFKVVKWAAMHLLESAIEKNRKKLRIEQLLLLIVRCSIPLLLALCMARPVLMGAQALLGSAKTSMVVLLDNSYSMEAGGPGRASFPQAKEAAGRILDNLASGSEVSVVTMGGRVAGLFEEPSFDVGRVRDELMKTSSGYGAADVPESLRLAGETLEKMHHTYREVVILTDFQEVSWSSAQTAARLRGLEALQKGKIPPTITLFQLGTENTDNVSIAALDLSRMILGVGQKLQVRANLQNHGDRDYPDLKVVFRVDGKERSVAQVSLGARQKGQVLFTHTFEEPGSHVVEAYADADPLQADNSCRAAIPVWSRVPVLMVSGDPNAEPLRGETDYLAIALQPYGSAKAELSDLVSGRAVEAKDLTPAALAEARVAILANVPQLDTPQLKALEDFVREGGGLLIFPGNRINSAWYNTTFAAGLLPAPLVSLAGTLRESEGHATIVGQHFDHPALEMFNDPRNGNLSDAQVWLWYKLKDESPGGKGKEDGMSVLARLDSGDPFLVEKPFGEGRVIQCCVPCDADWSNLPMRPFYLPVMQQIVTYLASKVYPPRNVDVGKPLVAFLPVTAAGKQAVVTDPVGKTFEVPVAAKGSRGIAEFAETHMPGLYTFDVAGGGRIHFVVNADRRESELARLPEPEIDTTAKALGASLVRSWNEYRQADEKRRYGQEIWTLLLGILVAMLFAELILQQFIVRRRPAP